MRYTYECVCSCEGQMQEVVIMLELLYAVGALFLSHDVWRVWLSGNIMSGWKAGLL